VSFQQVLALNAGIKSSFSGGVQPVFVMKPFAAVNGEPHEEIILFKERSPGVINKQPVGLKGVMNLCSPPMGRGPFRELPEPVKTRQGRLASLKGKGYLVPVVQILVHIPDDPLHGIGTHDPVGMDLSVSANVIVKTIPAAHVTEG
jgi:hypothetical protein